MKSINDDFFKSKEINHLQKVYGGCGGSNTCVLTREDNHTTHDGDKKDPDSGGGTDGAPSY